MNIAVLCGSPGSSSANRSALDVAIGSVEGTGSVVAGVVQLGDVPLFRPDQVDRPPEQVAELRLLLDSVDLVLLAAPEYGGGLAGVTKNALDWLVGSGSLYHKVVAIMSVGTTGGQYALEQLVRTLSWQGALVVSVLGVSAPKTKTDDTGQFTDDATIDAITDWVTTAIAARAGSTAKLLQRLDQVVTPYGIDTARFGDLC